MQYSDLFFYKDGHLFWKIKRRGLVHTRPVGSLNKNYKWIKSDLLPKQMGVHRVIWEMHNGPIPNGFVIDHIDRNTLNNSIENLRLATKSQNSMNAKGKAGKNSNLPKNVHVDWVYKGKIRYRAQVVANGKMHRLGNFINIADAELAAKELVKLHHGKFGLFVKEE
jgi:hypothetical protein